MVIAHPEDTCSAYGLKDCVRDYLDDMKHGRATIVQLVGASSSSSSTAQVCLWLVDSTGSDGSCGSVGIVGSCGSVCSCSLLKTTVAKIRCQIH